jgi:hypothetical protein
VEKSALSIQESIKNLALIVSIYRDYNRFIGRMSRNNLRFLMVRKSPRSVLEKVLNLINPLLQGKGVTIEIYSNEIYKQKLNLDWEFVKCLLFFFILGSA